MLKLPKENLHHMFPEAINQTKFKILKLTLGSLGSITASKDVVVSPYCQTM